MKIYITSPLDKDNKKICEYLKELLVKDQHSVMTYYEMIEKTKSKSPEEIIKNSILVINNNPIELLVFTPGWDADKKSLAEIYCARNQHIKIVEYKDKQFHEIDTIKMFPPL